jgi:hypothetical protein
VVAFQPKAKPNHSAEQERIVLAELMAEHVAPKTTLGEQPCGD